MKQAFKRYGVLAVAVLVVVSYGWRWWQGPALAVYQVKPMPLVQTLVAAGRVTNEVRVVVASEVTAMVAQRFVQEGDAVAVGEPLLQLRADTLLAQQQQLQAALTDLVERQRPQAAAALAQAELNAAQAEKEAQRRAELFSAQLVSAEALEQAQQQQQLTAQQLRQAQLTAAAVAAQGAQTRQLQAQLQQLEAELAKTLIRAPAAGMVLTRAIEAGDVAVAGQPLFTLALNGVVEVRAFFDERNMAQLALGQPAQIVADAYPAQPFQASVSYLAPTIDAERGTLEVRLVVSEPPDFLRQDLTVSVNIETAHRAQALTLPNELLQRDGDRATVWVVDQGQAVQKTLQLGLRGLTMTEVVAGLAVDDWVIRQPPSDLKNGQAVRPRVVE